MIKKLICKIFKHKFNYYILDANSSKNVRFCLRCGLAQEWKPIFGEYIWMNLVQRTKQGAKKYFGESI